MGPVRGLANILDRPQGSGRSRLERLGTFSLCVLQVRVILSATLNLDHLDDIRILPRIPLPCLEWFVFDDLYSLWTLFLLELLRRGSPRSWVMNRSTSNDGDGNEHVILERLKKVGNVEEMNVGS